MPKSRGNSIAQQQQAQNGGVNGRGSGSSVSDSDLVDRLLDRMISMVGSAGSTAGAAELVQQQRVDDIAQEESRSQIHNVLEDDEFFYSDDEEAFQEALQRARAEELEYETENVLNGSQNTFGLEIEFVGGNADAIARDLYELGICAYDRRMPYHTQGVDGKWRLERDGSVSDGGSGGELVSPILQDTPETWHDLEKICEVAARHGARIDQRCGGHVHMGMDPLDTARQRWKRFFRAAGGFENVISRVAGGDQGRIRGNADHYATPYQNEARRMLNSRFELNNDTDVNQLTQDASRRNRYYGINLTNIYQSGRPNTVEFRYFNSSLDPRVLQNNVRIANGVMLASEKARITSDGAMKRRGEMLRSEATGRNNDNAVKSFVDIMFTRKKDKDAVLKLYAKNEWRS